MSAGDRVAVVTGGGRGIGREICRSLAEQGRTVVVLDMRAEEAAETAASVGGHHYVCDVTDSDGVRATLAAIAGDVGPVDVLVNCAGWDEFHPFVETDEPFWDRIIDINYKGVLRTVHAVLPGMQQRGWGRIVNIASDAGRVGSSLEAVYAGAKGAVIAFSKTVAREAARHGVTCNVVCPGPTDTPLLAELAATDERSGRLVGSLSRVVPMGRVGRAEDIGPAVAYFTSDAAEFATGQTLSVSGGLTMS